MVPQHILEKFGVSDIIAIDTEYSNNRRGCRVRPLCLGAKSLVTEETHFLWHKDSAGRPALRAQIFR